MRAGNAAMGDSMNWRKYAVWGALVGVWFPAAGTVLQAALDTSAPGFWACVARAQAMPLLWVVDTAPLFLGVLAALTGLREDQRLAADGARRAEYLEISREMLRSAQEMLGAVSSFSAITAQTAASVREANATMNQLAHTAAHSALTAETVVGLASSTQRCSEDGLQAVATATGEMLQLAEDVRELSTRIETLNARMREMFQVATVVDALSDRSQQVVARAAREVERSPAAQAFGGIVAEMRQHSEDAQRSAQLVKRMMGEAHTAMLAAMTRAERGFQRAERGAEVARSAGETIRRLSAALQDSSRAARDIAQVALQQDREVDEVLKAMNEIFRGTEQTMAGTRQVACGARALNDLASRLQRSVEPGGS
jgi:methyl-accepting chemotaxis protein